MKNGNPFEGMVPDDRQSQLRHRHSQIAAFVFLNKQLSVFPTSPIYLLAFSQMRASCRRSLAPYLLTLLFKGPSR